MKLRALVIGDIWIEDLLLGKINAFETNLPKDIKILHVEHDKQRSVTKIVVISDEFEDVEDTYPIPEFKVLCIRKNNKSE